MDATHQRTPISQYRPVLNDENGGRHGVSEVDHEDQGIAPKIDEEKIEVWKPRTVTVEPVIFLYLFAGGLSWPTFNALIYHKVCSSHYDNITCNNLHNRTFHIEEDTVQAKTSYWFLWHNYCFEIPGILLAIGYGSLSDHVSRRMTIVLPVAGQILCNIVYLLSALFMGSPVVYTLVGGIISGISGGWITLFMACFSYLSEAVSMRDRTKRVLIAEGIAGLSIGIALISSGFFLDHTNYRVVFSTVMGIYTFCVIFIMAYIQEPPKKNIGAEKGKKACTLFLHRMKAGVTVVFRKRENNARIRILTCMGIILTSMISGNAIHTVGFLFLKRTPLSWTQSQYGIFTALHAFIPSAVLLFVTPFVQRRFKIRDTTLLLTGLASHVSSELWFSFCTKSWMVYTMPFIASLKSGSTVLRSTISQLVPAHELGKTFAILGALQSVSGLVGSTIYNTIYPHTLHFWPGFCFTLGSFIAIVPVSMACWLHRDLTNSPILDQSAKCELEKISRFDDQDPLLYGATDDELNEDDEVLPTQRETVIS